MDAELLKQAEAAKGFMPKDEGLALYEAALASSQTASGQLLEVGSYCGKSAIYIGAAAQQIDRNLFCVDHHHGSEENQAGWEHHDPDLVNPETGRMDTLPHFRNNIHKADLENAVIAIVGDSVTVAKAWNTPLCFLFIDGGHGQEPAHNDFDAWTPHISKSGTLCIHDVFENPEEGGRPPYEIYCKAIDSGDFKEVSATGSLRVLKKT